MIPAEKELSERKVSSGDIGVLAFLTLLNFLNFVDRQLLSSFANWIVPELELTNTEFGLLTGLVFIFFYATMGLFMGALADRLNRTRLIAAGLFVWSALTALSGAAKGFVSLALPRMFIGVGESVLTPSALSILNDRFPQRWHGLAVGIYGMGVPVGVAGSLFTVAYLEPLLGWRGCFYLLGGIGVLLAVVMLFIRETPRRNQRGEAQTAERPSFKEISQTLSAALRASPALVLVIAGAITANFVMGASSFDQLWLVEERGFDRLEIARTTALIGVIGGVLGNLVGGWGGDVFLRKTGMGRPMFLAFLLLLIAPINVAFRIVDGESIWFWIGLGAIFFQIGCFFGPIFSTIQDLVPSRIRATVVGFQVLAIQLIGIGIGVTTGGMTIDWLDAQGSAEPYSETLLIFTLISLGGIPMFFLAGRRFEKDRQALLARWPDA